MLGRVSAIFLVGRKKLVEEARRDPRLKDEPSPKVGAHDLPVLGCRLVVLIGASVRVRLVLEPAAVETWVDRRVTSTVRGARKPAQN